MQGRVQLINWVMFNWIKPFQSCRKLWQDNRDRIIRLTVAWLIRSKTGFWPNLETSTAAVNAVKKDGDLVWPQCQGGRKYKFQCQQITINCTPRKSPLFCTTNYLDHNCLDCGSFEVYLQLFWTIDSPAQYFMNSHGISVAYYLVNGKFSRV